MTITAQESTFEELVDGVYVGIFRSWEPSKPYKEGDPESVKLIWALPEVDPPENKDTYEKWQWCTQRLTPRTNLWAICKALGREPILGEQYEIEELLDPLVGAQVQLVIVQDDAGKAKIDNVLPMPAQAGRPGKSGGRPKSVNGAGTPGRLGDPGADLLNICGVKTCGDETDHFTSGGTPLCKDHTADDL